MALFWRRSTPNFVEKKGALLRMNFIQLYIGFSLQEGAGE